MKMIINLLVWLSACLVSQLSVAAVVGLQFEGLIESPTNSFQLVTFEQGESFSFSLTVDSSVSGILDTQSSSPDSTRYIMLPPSTFTFEVADGVLIVDENTPAGLGRSFDQVDIYNDRPVSEYDDLPYGDVWTDTRQYGGGDDIHPGAIFNFVQLALVYDSATLENENFFVAGDLANLIYAEINIIEVFITETDPIVTVPVKGVADLSTVQAVVPLPAAAWFFISGIAGLTGWRKWNGCRSTLTA